MQPDGVRLCKCHGVPLERNPGSKGGWRCVIRRRANHRPKNKETNRRRVYAGRAYLGLARTQEQAVAVNEHVGRRLADFKETQRRERDGWRDRQAVA